MQYGQGNPGAMIFLMNLIAPENIQYCLPIAVRLDQMPSLRGTNLYVLWSDLCGRNISLVAKLCESCPNDILEDACSRQDYSGRELVSTYL